MCEFVGFLICGLGTCTSASIGLVSTAECNVVYADTLYDVQSEVCVGRRGTFDVATGTVHVTQVSLLLACIRTLQLEYEIVASALLR